MAVKNEEEAAKRIQFLKEIGHMKYPDFMLKPEEVHNLLGEFSKSKNFNDETRFIWTPDQPFPEGELLRNCEEAFLSSSVHRERIVADAALYPSNKTKNGYVVRANGVDYDTKKLFVIAGINTPNLLMPLGIDGLIDVTARRCVLLKADIRTDLKVAIYMDKVNNTNINIVKNKNGDNVYLFGDGLYTEVEDINNIELKRQVTDEEVQRFISNYCDENKYPQLERKLSPFFKDIRNFNVCYKVENQSYLPWIYNMGELTENTYKNLHVAGAGKATLAFYVAEKLIYNAGLDSTKYSGEENAIIKDLSLIAHWSEC
jgi:hypothetical protein